MDCLNKHISKDVIRQIDDKVALINQEYSINIPEHLFKR
jgi:hypothetical protein